MADLADLFPGFESRWASVDIGRIFARVGGSGPPLLLIHGFPQTHVEWHRIAAPLAERFTVVAMDLRGYGWSSAPRSQDGVEYSKRVMARDAVALMRDLGFVRFRLAGHDRGARVAYRLALDHPGVVEALAVLDIVPTAEMWRGMDAARALQVYHWSFLAQPAPLPEMMISKVAIEWLEHTLASWTLDRSLKSFDPRALAHYRAFFGDPARIHACCEDYRAGATIDRALDEADLTAGRRIEPPLLALWGAAGIPAAGRSPLDVWRGWAREAKGVAVESGHFLPEENPRATVDALLAFF
ncbi:MAG: alpha/beta hydrolase [Methylobacteriaceae bacterium]|nr:alpha/beta hydrolase [Methylobacteriaceae bacterium]